MMRSLQNRLLSFRRAWPAVTAPKHSRTGTRNATSITTDNVPLAREKYANEGGNITGPDGAPMVILRFQEEPLGMPVSMEAGFPQFEFGESIGPDNQYTILRKLGRGNRSTTWLARDNKDSKFVAIKALTGYATQLIHENNFSEPSALKRFSEPPSPSPHCLKILSEPFVVPGKGSSGQHICLVTQLGRDIASMAKVWGIKRFPIPLAKRILLHSLRGLASAHERGYIHTNIQLNRFLFEHDLATDEIEKNLAAEPPRRYPQEISYDGPVQTAVSQPLPVPSIDEAMKLTYFLGNWNRAHPLSAVTNEWQWMINRYIEDENLPPEVWIDAVWNEKLDIWAFGCMIFKLLTGDTAFSFEECPELDLYEMEHLLWQMHIFTGENFPVELLKAGPDTELFFDKDYNLQRCPRSEHRPWEARLQAFQIFDEAEIPPIARLIRRCIRIDPKDRASAKEILTDPWFSGVD